jgi:hypothetical protein
VASFQEEEGEFELIELGLESFETPGTNEEGVLFPKLEAVPIGPPPPIKTLVTCPLPAGITIGVDRISLEFRGETTGETDPELEPGDVAFDEVEEEQVKTIDSPSKVFTAGFKLFVLFTFVWTGVEILAWYITFTGIALEEEDFDELNNPRGPLVVGEEEGVGAAKFGKEECKEVEGGPRADLDPFGGETLRWVEIDERGSDIVSDLFGIFEDKANGGVMIFSFTFSFPVATLLMLKGRRRRVLVFGSIRE